MNATKLKKVLIIDDEEQIVSILKVIVQPYTDKIEFAYNGADGIDLIKAHEFDCILSDINMPKLDGIDVLKETRNLGVKSPFVLFTAHGNDDLRKSALKYGAYAFVDKPFFEQIEVIIEKLISESKSKPDEFSSLVEKIKVPGEDT